MRLSRRRIKKKKSERQSRFFIFENMKIHFDKQVFKTLFKQYYAELDCPDDTAHLVEEYIIPDMLAGLLRVELAELDGQTVGFVIYQIDDIDNEWNFKEGFGDVREIYVAPSARRKGVGRFLMNRAENELTAAGAKGIYCLPCDAATPFFKACGYAESDEYCDELDCPVLIK